MKCVKGLGFLWVAALAAFFALSACDDSSSASSDETGVSSSSVETSDLDESSSSVDKKSSGNESTEKDKSSSSVKGSEPVEVSSSSAKETKNSSDSKSSSSVKSGDSSSSNKDKSSSSVSSSSSENSVSSSSSKDVMGGPCPKEGLKKKIGDEFAKCVDGVWVVYLPPSSSSVASSSSRGYEPLPSPLGYNLSYGEYEDTRDGTKYATIEITNKYGPDSIPKITFTVFAQNLKYHEKITLGANEQDDDTKVEMYCYNDSVEYCNDWWGGLYQWAEMMALPYECNSKSCADRIDPDHDGFHQGICPNGWHLITEKEMLAVSYSIGKNDIDGRAESVKSAISFSIAGGNNYSGLSMIATGYRDNEKGGTFDYLHEGTLFDFPEEFGNSQDESCRGGGVFSRNAFFAMGDQKKYGVSVRCVKNY